MYAWYVLGVLFLVYVVNFIDRQMLSILAEDIKHSLAITDAQIGFLYGTAFAVFYALFGIPLGRLADRWNRVRLIALGLGAWSAMTAVSGLAAGYGQLVFARIGVGIGEASASPAAYSLLGDYFPRERRGTALAIYSAGLFVGAGLSLPLGGWASESWTRHFAGGNAPFGLAGWQAAFLIVGLPGLLLALWVSSLREPARGGEGRPERAAIPGAWRAFTEEVSSILPPLTLWSVSRIPGGLHTNLRLLAGIAAITAALTLVTGDLPQWCALGIGTYAVASWVQKLEVTDRPTHSLIWRTPAVLYALGAFSCLTFVTYALVLWAPPYAMRTFGLRADAVGLLLGIPSGAAAAAGVAIGGPISDFLRRRSARGRIFACMLSAVLPPPILFAALWTADVRLFCVLLPLAAFAANLYSASMAASIQDCLLPRMRGTGAAVSFIAAALGLAIGPYFAGRVSVLTGSLRLGMLSVLIASPAALFLLWRASRVIAAAEASCEARAAAAGEPAAVGVGGSRSAGAT